jgi:excinuclease ABC subunit C
MLFLKGRKKELLVNLSKRMREASKNKVFEEAARLRDQIRARGSVGRKAGLFSADRIEGFDISDISGKEAVGSMVSFLNGKPDKSNYRRFRIKTVFAIDDYKMMQEVIRRRYKRLLRENGPIPAMIIIDGGKGHVNAAKAVLAELHLDNIKLFGIAKKEDRIFSSKGEEHIAGELKTIIQRVRDEAHRFAQGYHHILRRKRLLEE